jgi:hypothetical protein
VVFKYAPSLEKPMAGLSEPPGKPPKLPEALKPLEGKSEAAAKPARQSKR